MVIRPIVTIPRNPVRDRHRCEGVTPRRLEAARTVYRKLPAPVKQQRRAIPIRTRRDPELDHYGRASSSGVSASAKAFV